MYFCFIIHTFISSKEEHPFKSKCIYNCVSMKDDFCKILKKFQVLLFTIYVFSFKSCVYKLPIGSEKWPLLFFFGPFLTVLLFTSWFYNMKCLNCYFDINTSIIYGLNILKVIELNWMIECFLLLFQEALSPLDDVARLGDLYDAIREALDALLHRKVSTNTCITSYLRVKDLCMF